MQLHLGITGCQLHLLCFGLIKFKFSVQKQIKETVKAVAVKTDIQLQIIIGVVIIPITAAFLFIMEPASDCLCKRICILCKIFL